MPTTSHEASDPNSKNTHRKVCITLPRESAEGCFTRENFALSAQNSAVVQTAFVLVFHQGELSIQLNFSLDFSFNCENSTEGNSLDGKQLKENRKKNFIRSKNSASWKHGPRPIEHDVTVSS